MSAIISADKRYRYALWREWDTGTGTCLFVMLNPSTADAEEDDPTIRRCIGYAKRWGAKRLAVGNLFALRSTDPKLLNTSKDPIGPDNDEWLAQLVTTADLAICAWGAVSGFPERRAVAVRYILRHPETVLDADRPLALKPRLRCLKLTQKGHPSHPLYLRKDLEPIPLTP